MPEDVVRLTRGLAAYRAPDNPEESIQAATDRLFMFHRDRLKGKDPQTVYIELQKAVRRIAGEVLRKEPLFVADAAGILALQILLTATLICDAKRVE